MVQGGVGSAILDAVVAEDLPDLGSVFLQLDLRFAAPIRPGDVTTAAVEVTSARQVAGSGRPTGGAAAGRRRSARC